MGKSTVWPVAIVMMLSAVGVLNCILYVTANRQPSILIEQHPYEQSLIYGGTLEAIQRFKQLGWQVTSHYSRTPDGVDVRITLQDSLNEPISNKFPRLVLKRPNDASQDLSEDLREVAPGIYQRNFAKLRTGTWITELHFESPERALFRETIRVD